MTDQHCNDCGDKFSGFDKKGKKTKRCEHCWKVYHAQRQKAWRKKNPHKMKEYRAKKAIGSNGGLDIR